MEEKINHTKEFSGSSLIRGEPDASSFPNGGIRSTSQARGYTTWEPSSPPFVRINTNGATLYIPSCFCSWTGAALDVKTPLLRSLKSLSVNSARLLRLLGDERVHSVSSTVGAEQEFFLIDRAFFTARPDLIYSGRTIIGANPPRGQEMADHYYAKIPPRVLACIQEVETELWRLGVPSKARHNEMAPSQYEMSPIFETANLAADHNMIHMDVLKDVAHRHGLSCLLHEKPFAGINGSGKHNNWSMVTDYGLNLLEPSKHVRENYIFHVFLACVLRAVDVHGDLLRASVSTPGNDFRLGSHEAPPAIMSVYLGSDITELVDYLLASNERKSFEEQASPTLLNLGYADVPPFERDKTDRNRTSPFAFTGNKFEFRAPGSSQNVGHTTTIINAIVSESIERFTERMEAVMDAERLNPKAASRKVVVEFLEKHKRIIYNGNCYSKDWKYESQKRGLPFICDTVSGLEQYKSIKNIKLFEDLGIFTPDEMIARCNIYFEHYCQTLNVEANCAINLSSVYVLPAAFSYQHRIANSILKAKDALQSVEELDLSLQEIFLSSFSKKVNKLIAATNELSDLIKSVKGKKSKNLVDDAVWYRDCITVKISEVRQVCDAIEEIVDEDLWSLPKYADILFLK